MLYCPVHNTCMYIQTDQIILKQTGTQWSKLTIFKNNLLFFMYKEKNEVENQTWVEKANVQESIFTLHWGCLLMLLPQK